VAKPDLSSQFDEVMRPFRLMAIGMEAIEEVSKAREKHGSNADLADGTGRYQSILNEAHTVSPVADTYRDRDEVLHLDISDNEDLERALKKLNDDRCADGRKHTRLGILLEEAFEAAASESPEDLRAELVQVVAMGIDWIADLDARA